MDELDWKIRRFLVDEGYLFPQTDAEIERAFKELQQMFIAEMSASLTLCHTRLDNCEREKRILTAKNN